jgi:hypothetical protein
MMQRAGHHVCPLVFREPVFKSAKLFGMPGMWGWIAARSRTGRAGDWLGSGSGPARKHAAPSQSWCHPDRAKIDHRIDQALAYQGGQQQRLPAAQR